MVKKKVGIWIRVSTEDQARGDSPEHHERRAHMYAEAKGWQVVEVYHLEGVSGKDVLNNPEAHRMLRDIKSKKVEALIFSKLARLARNTKQLLDFADFFQQHDADLVSLQESIDTSSPSGRLFYTLIAAMAQWEREEISDRVSASIPIRAKLGKRIGGPAPYGYRWNGNTLELNEEEVPIRRRMFELFLEHKRKKTVAKILNDEGIRTRSGAKWSSITITRLLRDSIAKGIRRSNYSTRTKDSDKFMLKPAEEWVMLPAPKIVPEIIWKQVNDILDSQSVPKKQPLKKAKYLFTGILKCGPCNTNMYAVSNSPKYVCRKCRTKILTADLESIYHEQLKEMIISDAIIQTQLKESNLMLEEKERDLEYKKNKLVELQTKIKSLLALYTEGQIPANAFKEYHDPLYEQKTQLETSLTQLQGELDYLKIHLPSREEIIMKIKDVYARWDQLTFDEKRSLIQITLDDIVIGEGRIDFNARHLPDPDMLNMSKSAVFGVQNPADLSAY